jgi:hypothetical protein
MLGVEKRQVFQIVREQGNVIATYSFIIHFSIQALF